MPRMPRTYLREGPLRQAAAGAGAAAAMMALASGPAAAQPVGGVATSPACHYGPLLKTFGASQWHVYACNGPDDMVVMITARDNPAYFSYVLLRWRSGMLQTHAEGKGDAKARDAAKDEVSRLSRSDFLALRDAAMSKGDETVRQAQRPASAGAPRAGLPETPGALPFRTVAEARRSLEANRDVTVSTKDGWTVVVDNRTTADSGAAIWSFTPPGHPAHPAVVRRQPVRAGKSMSLDMRVLCEARKAACDDLVKEFQALNRRIVEDMEKRSRQPH